MKRFIYSVSKHSIQDNVDSIYEDIAIHLEKFIEDPEVTSSLPYGPVSSALKRLFKQYYNEADFDTDRKTFNYAINQLCYDLNNEDDIDKLAEDIDENYHTRLVR